MFDTPLTIVGNVLVPPKTRRTVETNQLAASFRVASTSRRFDRATDNWVDGQSLRVRVTCWRRLAEGVAASLKAGDPVIVTGRLYTRDWVDEEGNHRVLYEMDANAVGHDLARGRSKFVRNTQQLSTSAIEDAEAERRIGGEDSVPATLPPVPAGQDDDSQVDDFAPDVPTEQIGDGEQDDLDDLDDFDDEFGGHDSDTPRRRELVPA